MFDDKKKDDCLVTAKSGRQFQLSLSDSEQSLIWRGTAREHATATQLNPSRALLVLTTQSGGTWRRLTRGGANNSPTQTSHMKSVLLSAGSALRLNGGGQITSRESSGRMPRLERQSERVLTGLPAVRDGLRDGRKCGGTEG